MEKHFNITGPCRSAEHYMVPTSTRCAELRSLVENGKYFVLHAPRQTGKTTLVKDFVASMSEQGRFVALYCSLETAQGFPLSEAMPLITFALSRSVAHNRSTVSVSIASDSAPPGAALMTALSNLCAQLDKPLVLLFDEVDCLEGTTLVSFLRQLRNGYVDRGEIPFPHSVCLVGMRNIRDYRAQIRSGRETLGSASPFNIAHKAITLENFSREELELLFAQHQEETGQEFPRAVTDLIYRQTNGQPWLCNAIAREIVEDILENNNARDITEEQVEQAIENIILRRDTHIDSLLERLREPRVRRVVEPVISGDQEMLTLSDDDAAYTFDLGILRMNKGDVEPANPIYAEVIMRTLSFDYQHKLPVTLEGRFIRGGRLEMNRLMAEFQEFWRENSTIWTEMYDYKEAAPHLILQAFLQRIVNGGGTIQREYSAGRGRIDLCISVGRHRYPIELKIRRDGGTRDQGIEQLAGYMDTLGVEEGWLILFDRDPERDWNAKLISEDFEHQGKTIHLFGC